MDNPNLRAHVAQNLRACQLRQFAILQAVDSICCRHGIDYWLDGGTLLGAVRHGGFIPWDDDIDIGMTLQGLENFLRVAPSELPTGLFLQTRQTDPTAKEPIVKVRDLNSLYVEAGDRFDMPYQKGLYIDIFPFIAYPSVPRRWVKAICRTVSVSYSILHTPHYYTLRAALEFMWFGLKYLLCRGLWAVLYLLFPRKKYISNILINNGYGIMHRRDAVFPLSQVNFEGRSFPAPSDVHAYLTDLYGDYTTIPPAEQQKIHARFICPVLNPNLV